MDMDNNVKHGRGTSSEVAPLFASRDLRCEIRVSCVERTTQKSEWARL